MKALKVLTVSVALAGAFCAHAEDVEIVATADNVAVVPQASASPAPTRAAATTESTLLSQANAVFAALRRRSAGAAELEISEIVTVDPLASGAPEPPSNCRLMAVPGSRIKELRCYEPSEGELALNRYQFQQEMREIREQQAIQTMERSSYERALLETAQGIRPEQQ